MYTFWKIKGRRRRRDRRLDGITNAVDMDVGKPREMVRDREACRAGDGAAESDSTWQLNNNNNVYTVPGSKP